MFAPGAASLTRPSSLVLHDCSLARASAAGRGYSLAPASTAGRGYSLAPASTAGRGYSLAPASTAGRGCPGRGAGAGGQRVPATRGPPRTRARRPSRPNLATLSPTPPRVHKRTRGGSARALGPARCFPCPPAHAPRTTTVDAPLSAHANILASAHTARPGAARRPSRATRHRPVPMNMSARPYRRSQGRGGAGSRRRRPHRPSAEAALAGGPTGVTTESSATDDCEAVVRSTRPV